MPNMSTATVFGLTLTLSPSFLTALRIAPLIGSTASLTHAYMELVTTSSFYIQPPIESRLTKSIVKEDTSQFTRPASVNKRIADAKDIVIPVWFSRNFNVALWSVIGLNSISTYSALANLYLFPEGLGPHRKWYLTGLAAALGHYLFVPGVMWSVQAVFRLCVEQEKGHELKKEDSGKAVTVLKGWVGVHKIRMATVDLAAWVSFAVGVVGVLSLGL